MNKIDKKSWGLVAVVLSGIALPSICGDWCWEKLGQRGDFFGGYANVVNAIAIIFTAAKFMGQQRALSQASAATAIWRAAHGLQSLLNRSVGIFLSPEEHKMFRDTQTSLAFESFGYPPLLSAKVTDKTTPWEEQFERLRSAFHQFPEVLSDIQIHFGADSLKPFNEFSGSVSELLKFVARLSASRAHQPADVEQIDKLYKQTRARLDDVEKFLGPIVRLERSV